MINPRRSAAFYSHLRTQGNEKKGVGNPLYLNLLGSKLLGEESDLFVEELLGVSPHAGGLALVQRQKRLLETLAKGLAGLAGEHRGEVVDADDGERAGVLVVLDDDGDGGVVKGGVDGVDGDGVVGVGGVARDVDDHAQLTARLGEELVVDEGGDGLGEVDLLSISLTQSRNSHSDTGVLTALRKMSC